MRLVLSFRQAYFLEMPVLSVDLACRSWSDLGVVLLEQKGALISCEIVRWNEPWAPPVVELALRLNRICAENNAKVLMLDGPQAWKSEENGQAFSRVAERAVNTPAKMGLPGHVLPGTYERFVGYCLALYDALARLGWQRLTTRTQPEGFLGKMLIESYPNAAWKSLGIKPLPAKRKCRVSDLAEAYAALTQIVPIVASQPPNHDQLQAIVGGLPGLAIEERSREQSEVLSWERDETVPAQAATKSAGSRIVGVAPRREGGFWREGFIALPVPPGSGPVQWIAPQPASRRESRRKLLSENGVNPAQ